MTIEELYDLLEATIARVEAIEEKSRRQEARINTLSGYVENDRAAAAGCYESLTRGIKSLRNALDDAAEETEKRLGAMDRRIQSSIPFGPDPVTRMDLFAELPDSE